MDRRMPRETQSSARLSLTHSGDSDEIQEVRRSSGPNEAFRASGDSQTIVEVDGIARDLKPRLSEAVNTYSGSQKDVELGDITGESKPGLNEAIHIYNDARTDPKYSDVARGLKSRHIQFIALGGTIGTGLFLGIGRAFSTAGPLSILLGYSIVGLMVYAMMMCLGEMATWLPLPGSIPQFAYRYIDPATGFAAGWNLWYASSITQCTEIAAAAAIIQYWEGVRGVSPAVWITAILVLTLFLNIFAVSVYGEAEFIFASVKIIALVGLLILALVIDLGGSSQGRLGFRYWNHPGAMNEYIAKGSWGRFLGFWSVMVNAVFSYGGIEVVAVAAGEAEDPRRNIPKAVRRVFWRIAFFYVLGSLAIGVLIPYNDENLLGAIRDGAPGAAQSPWVIAINRAQISALPSIINAVILTSATSSSNAWTFAGSRYLLASAQNGQAPRFLLKCTKKGVPIYCVLITWSIGCLTYMSCSSGSAVVFTWFQNLTAVTSLIVWLIVCTAYIRFWKAMKAQGIDRSELTAFRVRLNDQAPVLAYISGGFFAIVLVLNGWNTIAGGFKYQDFITSYIGIVIFVVFYIIGRLFYRKGSPKLTEVDLFTGKAALDAVVWPERKPANIIERVWFWIA